MQMTYRRGHGWWLAHGDFRARDRFVTDFVPPQPAMKGVVLSTMVLNSAPEVERVP